jgi:hypothetical protein
VCAVIGLVVCLSYMAACSASQPPSNAGRIGYKVAWHDQSVPLGSAAGRLDDPPQALELKVGEKATIVSTISDNRDFKERYQLRASRPGILDFHDDTLAALRVGETKVFVSNLDHKPMEWCDNHKECDLLQVTVTN